MGITSYFRVDNSVLSLFIYQLLCISLRCSYMYVCASHSKVPKNRNEPVEKIKYWWTGAYLLISGTGIRFVVGWAK